MITDKKMILSPTDTLVLHLFTMGAFNASHAPRWPFMKESKYWTQSKDHKLWLTSAGTLHGAGLRGDMEDIMMEMREKDEQK